MSETNDATTAEPVAAAATVTVATPAATSEPKAGATPRWKRWIGMS